MNRLATLQHRLHTLRGQAHGTGPAAQPQYRGYAQHHNPYHAQQAGGEHRPAYGAHPGAGYGRSASTYAAPRSHHPAAASPARRAPSSVQALHARLRSIKQQHGGGGSHAPKTDAAALRRRVEAVRRNNYSHPPARASTQRYGGAANSTTASGRAAYELKRRAKQQQSQHEQMIERMRQRRQQQQQQQMMLMSRMAQQRRARATQKARRDAREREQRDAEDDRTSRRRSARRQRRSGRRNRDRDSRASSRRYEDISSGTDLSDHTNHGHGDATQRERRRKPSPRKKIEHTPMQSAHSTARSAAGRESAQPSARPEELAPPPRSVRRTPRRSPRKDEKGKRVSTRDAKKLANTLKNALNDIKLDDGLLGPEDDKEFEEDMQRRKRKKLRVPGMKRRLTLRAVAYWCIFCLRVKRLANVSRMERRTETLEDFMEFSAVFSLLASRWVLPALKLPINSIQSDSGIDLTVTGQAGHAARRKLMRLEIRVSALCEALMSLARGKLRDCPEMPGQLENFVRKFLVGNRTWFPDGWLYEHEAANLSFQNDGATVHMTPNRMVMMVIGYFILRVVNSIVLTPWKWGMGRPVQGVRMRNLKTVASTLYVVAKHALRERGVSMMDDQHVLDHLLPRGNPVYQISSEPWIRRNSVRLDSFAVEILSTCCPGFKDDKEVVAPDGPGVAPGAIESDDEGDDNVPLAISKDSPQSKSHFALPSRTQTAKKFGESDIGPSHHDNFAGSDNIPIHRTATVAPTRSKTGIQRTPTGMPAY